MDIIKDWQKHVQKKGSSLGPKLDKLLVDEPTEEISDKMMNMVLPKMQYKQFSPEVTTGFEYMKQNLHKNKTEWVKLMERGKREYTHVEDMQHIIDHIQTSKQYTVPSGEAQSTSHPQDDPYENFKQRYS